jgi:hypothetical protein
MSKPPGKPVQHERQISKGDAGIDYYVERRGVREVTFGTRSVAADDSENPSKKARRLNLAANLLLERADEKTLDKVLTEARSSKSNDPHAEQVAISQWVAGLIKRHGFLGPVTVGAQFLLRQRSIVSKLAGRVEGAAEGRINDEDGTEFLQQMSNIFPIIYEFADAWHWWQMELHGEHGQLIEAEALAASRNKGAKANKEKKQRRESIIIEVFNEYHVSGATLENPAQVTKSIMATVKRKWAAEGVGQIAVDQVLRVVRRLISEIR